jgi:hypothetical protein
VVLRYGGCNGTGGTSRGPAFASCVPLSSTILLFGTYLYDSAVSVGGVACNCSSSYFSVQCLLPIIPSYVPGLYYDLQLVNSAGSLSLPGLVSFVGGPVVTGVTQCNNYNVANLQDPGGLCQPGTAIAVFGLNFYADDSLQIVLSLPSLRGNISCLQPAVLNSTALHCLLPTATSSNNLTLFLGRYMYLQAFFNSSVVVSNRVYLPVLDWPSPPIVSSVSGSCSGPNTALAVTGCAMGSVLTLSGSNLNGSGVSVTNYENVVQNGVSLGYSYFRCLLLSVSPSAISCLLPAPGDELQGSLVAGFSYTIAASLTDSMGHSRVLRPITVAFSAPAPVLLASTGSSSGNGGGSNGSGGSNTSVILIGVLVPVLVILLVLVAVLLWRRWRLTKRAGGSSAAAGSADDRFAQFTDVELR